MVRVNSNQKLFVYSEVDNKFYGYTIYTNKQMAEMCGVDERTIYRWKHNETINRAIREKLNDYKSINEDVSLKPNVIEMIEKYYKPYNSTKLNTIVNEFLEEGIKRDIKRIEQQKGDV